MWSLRVAIAAMRCALRVSMHAKGAVMIKVVGRTHLIFGGLCMKDGEKDVSITVAPGGIGGQDFFYAWWDWLEWRMRMTGW